MLFGGKHYGKHSITQACSDNFTAIFSVILLQISESWDSLCKQIPSPTPEPLSLSSKNDKS